MKEPKSTRKSLFIRILCWVLIALMLSGFGVYLIEIFTNFASLFA